MDRGGCHTDGYLIGKPDYDREFRPPRPVAAGRPAPSPYLDLQPAEPVASAE